MRRNPSYREDYKKVAKLRKKAGKLHSSKKSVDFNWYYKTSEFRIEAEICQKWGVNKMLNPDENFDEITGVIEFSKSKNTDSVDRVVQWAIGSWKSHESKMVFNQIGLRYARVFENFYDMVEVRFASTGEFTYTESTIPSGCRYFKIEADFKNVRSLGDLKSEVCALLETHYHDYKKTAGKKIYATDFDIILEVGDLKEAGWTNQKIAKKLYPRLFENKNANHESTIRNITYISRDRKIIFGYPRQIKR